jgi:hypothetical protein
VHLERLHELEYLVAHRGTRGQSYEYELAFDGDTGDSAPQLAGLIDAAGLQDAPTTASSRGSTGQFAAPSRNQNARIAAGLHEVPSAANPVLARLAEDVPDEDEQTHVHKLNGRHLSYVPSSLAAEVQR